MDGAAEQRIVERELAAGDGWRASRIQCGAGPDDAPFEETHEWVSVVAVLDGSFVYRSAHGRELMTPGSVLLGNQGACFCCSHEHGRGDLCVAFHFAPAAIEEMASSLRPVRWSGFRRHRVPPLDRLVPLLDAVRAASAAPDPLLIEETAQRLGGAALRLVEDADVPASTPGEERRVAAALDMIAWRHAEPLSLASLAEAAGLSRYHFLRVFRRVVGVTPYAYVLGRRLAAAAERLRSGDETVLDVALGCGFSDLSEFTRRFRSRFGLPPGRFRDSRRAAPHAIAAPSASSTRTLTATKAGSVRTRGDGSATGTSATILPGRGDSTITRSAR